MNERTLLERLREPGRRVSRRTEVDLERLAESIQRHLRRMFNCRQGHSETVPDYGLPDMTSIVRGSRESVSQLEESLRQCIERYEPRLTDVTVSNVFSEEDPFNMKFKITARIVVGDRQSGVWYETRIGPEGRVEVHG